MMMGFGTGERGNRFVCPNDRQLSLRAKLNTGWSVKTETLGYNSKVSRESPIAADEQDAIVQVIQRAEQLDVSEQERIGKLVERLETMRRNALGRNASQCLLCGDGFGILGAQKVMCMDCRRLACQKCAIDSCSSTSNSNHHPKEHWLCMICAETREIWKKSGAWFFKSIPKYILPTETPRLGRTRSVRMSRRYREDDSSSEDEKKSWHHRRQRRNSGTESTHGTIDQEPINGPTLAPNYSRQTSSTESQISKDMEPLKSHMSSITLNEVKNLDDSGIEDRRGETVCSEASRRESMTSRSMSDWNGSENRSDGKVSPSTCSVSSGVFKSSVDEPKSVDSSMGMIELSLIYDQGLSTLHCTVYRAKNLIPMDMSGLSDPFCKLNIMPNANPSTRLRTKTVHKTKNPEFNENLTFFEIAEEDIAKKSLHVLVVDDDKFGQDYMGEIRVPLAKLKYQNTVYLSLPLENLRAEQKGPVPTPELNDWFDDLWSRGQILLSLCYNTKKRALLVTVAKCVNLLPMDNNGLSDPFVKLQLKPNSNHKKHKTSIKWKNLNPEWNEEFTFETRPTELYTQSLFITVFDKDYGKSNDYLGGLILGGTGSKGLRLKHWMDMIRYPDHRHQQWHNLTEEILE